ncbi:hypothetical protein [Polaromonas vacuolata]|uniref:hypothetical protein n=1 Tax=Polaromonas vacuolata TaxID=37448 RepID=UPI0014566EFF|nr:hypothetical protein [Polaromonas vacuolata]
MPLSPKPLIAPYWNNLSHLGFLQAQKQLQNGTTPAQKIAVLVLNPWFTLTA